MSPRRPAHASRYSDAVRAFREAFPYVKNYSAWNEPNHGSEQRVGDRERPNQPTWDKPYEAGLFFQELRRQCARAVPK